MSYTACAVPITLSAVVPISARDLLDSQCVTTNPFLSSVRPIFTFRCELSRFLMFYQSVHLLLIFYRKSVHHRKTLGRRLEVTRHRLHESKSRSGLHGLFCFRFRISTCCSEEVKKKEYVRMVRFCEVLSVYPSRQQREIRKMNPSPPFSLMTLSG